jgi:hypothetical protein
MRNPLALTKRRVHSPLELTLQGINSCWDIGVSGPFGQPRAGWHNAVLKTFGEMNAAIEQVKHLGLPVGLMPRRIGIVLQHSIASLQIQASRGESSTPAAETYSRPLPSRALYRYRKLDGIDIIFRGERKPGAMSYGYGDITYTNYELLHSMLLLKCG